MKPKMILHECSIFCNSHRGLSIANSSNFARRIVHCVRQWTRHISNSTTAGAGRGADDWIMAIHIGKEIKAELYRQERGPTWLADKLHCDRTNVYNIFKRQGIDTRLLERISIILHRNFFTLYCQENNIVENDSTIP